MSRILKSHFSKLIQLTAIVLLVLLIQSCSQQEVFELKKPPQSPWQDLQQFELAVQYPYHATFQNSTWWTIFTAERQASVYMSDISLKRPGATYQSSYARETVNAHGHRFVMHEEIWNSAYQSIGNVNVALDWVEEKNENPFPEISQEDKVYNFDRIIGELRFIRAYNYFLLARLWLPVPGSPKFNTEKRLPLQKSFPSSMQQAISLPLATGSEVFDFITEELKTAKELLPERYIEGVMHPSYKVGRSNKFTAAALLSRVYFYLGGEQNHQLALQELNFVIDENHGEYDLSEDPIEAFNKSNATRGKEVIWQALYYDETSGFTPARLAHMSKADYNAINGGRTPWRRSTRTHIMIAYSAAKKIGWMDENLDETEDALKDKRYQQLYYRFEALPEGWDNPESEHYLENPDETYYETRYSDWGKPTLFGDKYFRGDDGRRTNVPVIRLAEMYLTRSIIRYKSGNMQGARHDLNRVRKRAGLEELTGDLTEEVIHVERMKELAWEGDRIYYLIGLEKDLPPGDRDMDVMPYPYDLYFPIPFREQDFYQ